MCCVPKWFFLAIIIKLLQLIFLTVFPIFLLSASLTSCFMCFLNNYVHTHTIIITCSVCLHWKIYTNDIYCCCWYISAALFCCFFLSWFFVFPFLSWCQAYTRSDILSLLNSAVWCVCYMTGLVKYCISLKDFRWIDILLILSICVGYFCIKEEVILMKVQCIHAWNVNEIICSAELVYIK